MRVFDLFASSPGYRFRDETTCPRSVPAGMSLHEDLFRSHLDNLIAPRHRLVPVAERVHLDGLNEPRRAFYDDSAVGRPPMSTWLMAGLLYLKPTYGVSDEALAER